MSYPLRDNAPDDLRTETGRKLEDLTLEGIRAGDVGGKDLSIHPETLRAQAEIAQEAGFGQLAANLRRAAELAQIPTEKVLTIYDALRPRRLRYQELLALADELERDYNASENARLIREAAQAYKASGLA